ncbi:MAG: KAP family NTPase [Mangrovicoccus sp.]|nr:KAP family NTPase [Mangrovicoccus sp.]
MRFAPKEDDITIGETGFEENDILGRKAIGKELSERLERFEDPIVVALDNGWGTGKSYFLKRWVGAHMNEPGHKAQTLYFDAFEHDYMADPLVALVSALVNALPDPSTGERIIDAGKKLAKPLARAAVNLLTFGAQEALDDMGDVLAEAVSGEAIRAVDDLWQREQSRKAAMEEFRAALKELTENGEKPLIIVVDELDRCRPDYALELLEIIKHFFSVDRVHFVLGVNLKALENSVKARYGAEIDASAYLQKFLSFTMSLPDHIGDANRTPAVIKYVEYLGKKVNLDSGLLAEIRSQFSVLVPANRISIRETQKIVATASLLPLHAHGKPIDTLRRRLSVTLIIAKISQNSLFHKLVTNSFSSEDIHEFLGPAEMLTPSTQTRRRVTREDLIDTWGSVRAGGSIRDEPELSRFIDPVSVYQSLSSEMDLSDIGQLPHWIDEHWLSTFNIPETASDPNT